MACKTYRELAHEIKPLMQGESQEDIDKAIKEIRAMDYADRADLYESTKGWAIEVLNQSKPRLRNARVEILGIKNTGKDYLVSYKYKYSKNDTVYTKYIGSYSPFTYDYVKNFDGNRDDLFRLFSDKEFINEGRAGYEEVAVDNLNEPQKMIDLAQELAEIDTVESSAWHRNKLLEGVKTIVGPLREFMPAMNIKLNKAASRNGGMLDTSGKKVGLYVGVGVGNRHMTALEAYTHELYHSVTKFAIDRADARMNNYLREIRRIKNEFIENTTAEQLAEYMLVPDVAAADEVLKYFSEEKVGLHEFVAYSQTNEAVMRRLADMKVTKDVEEHDNWASKLIAVIKSMLGRVLITVDKLPKNVDAYTAMEQLVFQLAQANNKTLEAKRENVMEKVTKPFVKAESSVVKFMEGLEEKAKNVPLPVLKEGKLSKALYLGKMAARAFVDENAKRTLEVTAGLAGLKPEGTVMTTIRDMSESDAAQDVAERLGLISQNIDQYRDFEYTQVALTLKEAFNRQLTDEEMNALTSVLLDADISSVYYGMDVKAMLEDSNTLNKEIAKLKKELKSLAPEEDYNYYTEQADGLGYYMVTGKGNIAQLLNADNIAQKLNSTERKPRVGKDVVESIDKLASLYALKYTSTKEKSIVAELFESETNGIEVMTAYQLAHKEKTDEALFKTASDKFKKIKGYTKEIYPKDVDMRIAPLKSEKEMRDLGYKLHKPVTKHAKDKNSVEMAMYLSSVQVRPNLHRVAMRYTDMGRRGTTLTESYSIAGSDNVSLKARRDIAVMTNEMSDIVAKMEKGEYTPNAEDYGIVPTLDNLGNVRDFRYIMNKEDKVNVLKLDRRAINTLGKMYASSYDKAASVSFNEQLMTFIEEDAANNYKDSLIGTNNKEYVKLEKYSPNAEIKDIWNVLPDNVKIKYPDGFVVRRDLMHSLLGYRELSIADMPLFKQMPTTAKHSLRVAEKIWKEIVKVAKVDIILRVPTVIIGNVTSNFMYSVMTGHSPLEIAKLQLDGVRELNEFMNGTKQIISLTRKVEAGLASEAEKRKLTALTNDLQSSTVKDLVDEGFYMTIIEELGLEEFTGSNEFTSLIEDKLKNYPSFIQNGVNLLYLNERTKLFKAINMATQYSDFVARYAQYHLMVRKGATKADAVKTVRDAFINYNKPNSRFVEWLNQMGFIMFTKYFTRIQKVLKSTAKKHPMKVLMAIIGQEWVTGDIEDVYDQSIVTKDLGNIFYNPLDTFIRAITPSGAEAVHAVYTKVGS